MCSRSPSLRRTTGSGLRSFFQWTFPSQSVRFEMTTSCSPSLARWRRTSPHAPHPASGLVILLLLRILGLATALLVEESGDALCQWSLNVDHLRKPAKR